MLFKRTIYSSDPADSRATKNIFFFLFFWKMKENGKMDGREEKRRENLQTKPEVMPGSQTCSSLFTQNKCAFHPKIWIEINSINWRTECTSTFVIPLIFGCCCCFHSFFVFHFLLYCLAVSKICFEWFILSTDTRKPQRSKGSDFQ